LTIAITAGRCLAGAWVSRLRIQWTRHRCKVAWKIFDAAARNLRIPTQTSR
jgi:hypothetical protein